MVVRYWYETQYVPQSDECEDDEDQNDEDFDPAGDDPLHFQVSQHSAANSATNVGNTTMNVMRSFQSRGWDGDRTPIPRRHLRVRGIRVGALLREVLASGVSSFLRDDPRSALHLGGASEVLAQESAQGLRIDTDLGSELLGRNGIRHLVTSFRASWAVIARTRFRFVVMKSSYRTIVMILFEFCNEFVKFCLPPAAPPNGPRDFRRRARERSGLEVYFRPPKKPRTWEMMPSGT